jgi:dimeric dUTPase (all-alpha-NTP-PPase superfamily)
MLDLKTIKDLLKEQDGLDRFIAEKNIDDKKDENFPLVKKIALLVEIGEFANEIKSFTI